MQSNIKTNIRLPVIYYLFIRSFDRNHHILCIGALSIKVETPQKLGKRFMNPFPSSPQIDRPFGVTIESLSSKSNNSQPQSSTPKSLAETIKTRKNTTKSLSSLLEMK